MRLVYLVTPQQILIALFLGVLVAAKALALATTYGPYLIVLAIIWFFLMAATHAALNVWAERIGGVLITPFHIENIRPIYSVAQVIARVRHLTSISNPELANSVHTSTILWLAVFVTIFGLSMTGIYQVERALSLIGASGWAPTWAFLFAAGFAWAVTDAWLNAWNTEKTEP